MKTRFIYHTGKGVWRCDAHTWILGFVDEPKSMVVGERGDSRVTVSWWTEGGDGRIRVEKVVVAAKVGEGKRDKNRGSLYEDEEREGSVLNFLLIEKWKWEMKEVKG